MDMGNKILAKPVLTKQKSRLYKKNLYFFVKNKTRDIQL